LGEALPWAAAWLCAALGFGRPVQRWLAPCAEDAFAVQIAFGAAILLLLENALGRLGLLAIGGGVGAWFVIGLGFALLLLQWRTLQQQDELSGVRLPPFLFWCATPAIAVWLIASASAPGWLWDTEYGGYDALSYHLQLPREWVELGAIMPLQHNVYSFLPSSMEAAYYHMMLMRHDHLAASYACQLLHTGIGFLAAFVLARAASCIAPVGHRCAATVAGVLLLGTPWVIVTGTLAYNEMPVLLMLAGGLLLTLAPRPQPYCPTRLGTAIGLLAATACGAKLTALGFVALPLVVVMLANLPVRQWAHACSCGLIAALLVLSPWLVSNFAESGNPVFPFAAERLGSGHWTAEQVATWNAGHQPQHFIAARLTEAWHQLGRFGIGQPPATEERWHAQWSVLPWLGAAAILSLLLARKHRRIGIQLGIIIVIQLLFWMSFTHIKSRFMLPMAVPAAIAGAVAIGLLREAVIAANSKRAWRMDLLLAAVLLLWCAVPVWVYSNQVQQMPALAVGNAHAWSGHISDPSTLRKAAELRAVVYLNTQLATDARVLFIGEAAPFYYRCRFTYSTTWDRGPISRLLREHSNDIQAISESLRSKGYTHVLVSPSMLVRWEAAGWNDPLITAESIITLAEAIGTLENMWPAGERLYRLHPPR
ncbi:MAG TPA: hypothetical protein PK400_12455, partial [Phycisphaerales bacterium]|nr:hypothetical protein [Phycisphaerales bacterium]